MNKRVCVLRWAAAGGVIWDRHLIVMRTLKKAGSNRGEGLGTKNMAAVVAAVVEAGTVPAHTCRT